VSYVIFARSVESNSSKSRMTFDVLWCGQTMRDLW